MSQAGFQGREPRQPRSQGFGPDQGFLRWSQVSCGEVGLGKDQPGGGILGIELNGALTQGDRLARVGRGLSQAHTGFQQGAIARGGIAQLQAARTAQGFGQVGG